MDVQASSREKLSPELVPLWEEGLDQRLFPTSLVSSVQTLLADRRFRLAVTITVLLALITHWFSAIWLPISAISAFLTNNEAVHGERVQLLPFIFQPLPLGSIRPAGWLQSEMQHSADGLAGHLHDFYRYVSQSTWLGGTHEYSQLNEGFPYWFNGIVPLAYGLDDERLKDQINSSLNYVLLHQHGDGWFGPETGKARNVWARYPFVLGLVNLVQADPSYHTRVLDALHKFNRLVNLMLNDDYLGYHHHEGDSVGHFDTSWGRVRMCDMLISLQWLLENDPRNETTTIVDNMRLLINGSLDWTSWYNEDVYIKEDLSSLPYRRTKDNYYFQHGVNIGQGFKAGAVMRRFTKNDSHIDDVRRAVRWTQLYHGAPSGVVLADERLQGLAPYYGSELCTVVETMFSLSYLYQALGSAQYADNAELVMFNALPAMVTADHWAHQYVAQPNQPFSENLAEGNPFFNVGQWGQTFGLEPNYPCCTVNLGQGLPKYLAAMFSGVGTNGIAHTLLGPANVNTTLLGGNRVSLYCETDYPFDSVLTYTVSARKAFDLFIRVPEWADISKVSFCSTSGVVESLSTYIDKDSRMQQVKVPAGDSQFVYTLPASISVEPRANDTVAVRYGALLYALDVGCINTSTHTPSQAGLPEQAKDYQMFNTRPWNIAIDPSTLRYEGKGSSAKLADPIFAPGAPPGKITFEGCEIEWPLYLSVPGPAPLKMYRKCVGSARRYTMRPYGSTKIRMTELPTVDLSADWEVKEQQPVHIYR